MGLCFPGALQKKNNDVTLHWKSSITRKSHIFTYILLVGNVSVKKYLFCYMRYVMSCAMFEHPKQPAQPDSICCSPAPSSVLNGFAMASSVSIPRPHRCAGWYWLSLSLPIPHSSQLAQVLHGRCAYTYSNIHIYRPRDKWQTQCLNSSPWSQLAINYICWVLI